MNELVLLSDSAAHRGERLGLVQRETLKRATAVFRSACEAAKTGPLDVPERARLLGTSLNLLVPEWVLEARAWATAAQVPTATLLAQSAPPEPLWSKLAQQRANGSTAFVASGASAAGSGQKAVLAVSLDGPDVPVCLISRASWPGGLAYTAVAEAGDIGIRAFVNEAGVAGTVLYCQPSDDVSRNSLLSPFLVLRHVAERAMSCAKIPALFEAIRRQGEIATPDKRGASYIFADATGALLLVEAGASKHRVHTQATGCIGCAGRYQLQTPFQTTVEAVRSKMLRDTALGEPFTPRRALNALRTDRATATEKAICNAETRSAFVAVLGLPGIKGCGFATLGSPLHHPYRPLLPGTGVPAAWTAGLGGAPVDAAAAPSTQTPESRQAADDVLLRKLMPVMAGLLDPALRGNLLLEIAAM